MRLRVKMSTAAAVVLIAGISARAEDWPRFRGPENNGKSSETGLLRQWPQGGPPMLWSVDGIGEGYGSAAIVNGKVYVAGTSDGDGHVTCLDTRGNVLWRKPYGREYTRRYAGSRNTPTVGGDKLYVYSALGEVVCLKRTDGSRVWWRDLIEEFKGSPLRWGNAAHPLIDARRLICTPGGPASAVVALDTDSGRTLWQTRTLSSAAAYCGPALIERDGARLIVTMVKDAIVGIDPDQGRTLWRYPYTNRRSIFPNTPVFADGVLYCTSGYGARSVALRLSDDLRRVEKVLWTKEAFQDTHHGGVILQEGHLYASNDRGPGRGDWMCVKLETGDIAWRAEPVRKGSAIFADGMLYCYGERGNVALVEATPEGCRVRGEMNVTHGRGEHWAHPSLSDGVLYIRHGDVLMAFDVKAGD